MKTAAICRDTRDKINSLLLTVRLGDLNPEGGISNKQNGYENLIIAEGIFKYESWTKP